MACCESCARGDRCDGGACGAKSSGAAAPEHPIVKRARTITGPHAVPGSMRARASGDVDMDFSDDPAQPGSTTYDPDDAAFLALVERTSDPAARDALIRDHLRAQGASEEAVRAGVQRFAEAGIGALTTYLRNELQTDLENIRSNTRINQDVVRERGLTARAEIEARARRDTAEANARANGGLPPTAPAAPTNWLIPAGGLLLLGLAAYALSQRSR